MPTPEAVRAAWNAVEPLLRSGHALHVDWTGGVTVTGPAVSPVLAEYVHVRSDSIRQALEWAAAAGVIRRVER